MSHARLASLLALSLAACKGGAPSAPPYAGEVAGARPAPKTSLDPNAAMAVVQGVTITAGEVDAQVKGQLTKMENEYKQNVYELRSNALQGMISQKLAEAEAKKAGVSPEELFAREIGSRVKPPSEAEIKAYYDQHQQQIPYPFEQVKERLTQMMQGESRQKAARDYLDGLKKKAAVQVLLQPPELPRAQVAADGPSKGPADAPVTIVEFSDFQCPFCSRVLPVMDQVMAEYKGKVRLVFRDFPLSFHQDAPKAAEASHCAMAQGKFWEMHDKLFGSQSRGLKSDDLKTYAKELGLDAAKFNQCLDSGQAAAAVQKNQADGEAAGVNGTPAFFVNGVLISGAQPFDQFKAIIDRELAVARK